MVISTLKNFKFTVLTGFLILILSVIPNNSNEAPAFYFEGMDKLIHSIMYATFMTILLLEYFRNRTFNISSTIVLGLLLLSYSIAMEFIQQYLIESRSGEVKDVLANLAGLLFGCIVVFSIKKIKS